MSQDLIRELHSIVRALAGSPLHRSELTTRFWAVALRLRAALPPLRLPVRTGPPMARLGFLVVQPAELDAVLDALSSSPAASFEDVWIYSSDVHRPQTELQGLTLVEINGVSELQAARKIADVDLDVLVDVGMALREMPLLIGLRPARNVIASILEPVCSGEQFVSLSSRGASNEPAALLRMARAAASNIARSMEQPGLEQPQALNAVVQRAIQLHHAGHLDEAAQTYAAVLRRYPKHPVSAYMLGQLVHQQGNFADAIALLQEAVQSAPEFRDAHYTLGQRLADCRRWPEAALSYRRAVELTPDFAAGWSGLGIALLNADSSQTASAVEQLERAVQLEPETMQWRFNLGSALQKHHAMADARSLYQQILLRDPDHEGALFNLGAVAHEQGDYSTAITAYQGTLQRRPGFADAYVGLGTVLQITGQIEAWVQNFQGFRAACPESLSMAVYGLEASMAAGDASAHCDWRDRILGGAFAAADPGEFILNWEQLLFLLLHVDVDRPTLRHWYDRYDAAATAWYGPQLAAPDQRLPGRPRIGYLSGDLREHVMGRMVYEWVSRHDTERFDIRLYSLSARKDAFTQRFIALGLPLIDLSSLGHREAAAKIRDDHIDLLIDCCGHTRGAQPGILAVRPARVSATTIATPGPLALRAVDYKLTDMLAEADDNQRYVLERLLPIDGGVYPWRRYPAPLPAKMDANGVKPGAFVCGTFVSLMKLSPRCLALWRRVLQALPEAVLAFSPQQSGWKPAYLRWLRVHGIADHQVIFLPHPPDAAAQLARYSVVDVVLDPLPCGNVNGTMEALAMGVPVVTLAGLRHGERLGNTLLRRFGVTDTIAAVDDAYVDAVVRIARDKAWATALREQIRQQLTESTVWDLSAQVRSLESAYIEMLDRARSGAQTNS